MLNNTDYIRVGGILILTEEVAVLEGLVLTCHIAFVDADFDKLIDIGREVGQRCEWLVQELPERLTELLYLLSDIHVQRYRLLRTRINLGLNR